MGRVVGVYLAAAGGLAMRSVQAAVAVAGQGLVGDRYQTGTGQWCYDRRLYDDVTLIAAEALDAAGAEHGVHLQAGEARRNLETCGVDLQALVGRTFQIGEVVLRGNRACEPCRYLDRVTGQPGKAALAGRRPASHRDHRRPVGRGRQCPRPAGYLIRRPGRCCPRLLSGTDGRVSGVR